jgi:hypothetical protein
MKIKADKKAVTIKQDSRLVSFPTGNIMVRRVNNDSLEFYSGLSNDKFLAKIGDITPKVANEFKNSDPTDEDSKKGKKGSIWYNNKKELYYMHDGKKYSVVNLNNVMEIYIHELCKYLNGAENF